MTLDELKEAPRLPDEEEALSEIVPVNPPRLLKLIVDEPDEPTLRFTTAGFAAMLKSGWAGAKTLMLTCVECEIDPLDDDTVTV